MWSFIKNKKQDRIGIGLLEYRGSTVTDPLSKANALADYFCSVFTTKDTTCVPDLEGDPLPEIPPIHIRTAGVAQLLLNLKTHKAAGPDYFPSYFLKEVVKSPQLFLLFFRLHYTKVLYRT